MSVDGDRVATISAIVSESAEPVPARFGVRTVQLAGFSFLDVSEDHLVELLVRERAEGRGGWVITPNVDILRQAHVDPKIRSLFLGADVAVPDGMPLIWASRLQGTPLRNGRICGSELIYSVPEACAKANMSIFLLGGAGNTGERTAFELRRRYPGLRIVGAYSPPFGFEKHPEQYDAMRKAIRDAKPDFIFVALSVPKTEKLIVEIRAAAPDAWWIGVGAAFDFVSGEIPRAPKLMQHTGTEWLFRMMQDPGRLIRRYLWEDLPYAAVLFASALKRRFGRTGPLVATGEKPATAENPRIAA